MAMLAEKKSKEKWSEDPRNIKWSSDKGRYGYQILEKMGWVDGKGLGSKQNGKTSHITIKKRKQNLGLGAKESNDKDWIAHQEDFNNLLSALQQHGGNAELRTEEQNKKAMLEVAKASRKRVFYKKFIHSKDTSQYSEKDLACIFGSTPAQSAPATPQTQSDNEAQSDGSCASCPAISASPSADRGFITYTSKQNIQEYFARRMKELRDGRGSPGIKEDNKEHGKDCRDSQSSTEKQREKKTKKKKRRRKEEAFVDVEVGKGGWEDGQGSERILSSVEKDNTKAKRKNKRSREKYVEVDEKSGPDCQDSEQIAASEEKGDKKTRRKKRRTEEAKLADEETVNSKKKKREKKEMEINGGNNNVIEKYGGCLTNEVERKKSKQKAKIRK